MLYHILLLTDSQYNFEVNYFGRVKFKTGILGPTKGRQHTEIEERESSKRNDQFQKIKHHNQLTNKRTFE